jgi:Flp pilus assembly protein TadD
MAEVVGAEFLTSPAIVGRAARIAFRDPGFDRLGADEPDRASLAAADELRTLEDAAKKAATLLSVDELRAEASVRLGYIALRLGRTDEALGHLDRLAELSATPGWRYLGHLYTGLTLARLNRVDEAAAAYRAALGVVPRARSATTLLTALLLTNGRLNEAEAESAQFLAAPEAPNDPWRTYLLGDFPQLPALLIRLREAIR